MYKLPAAIPSPYDNSDLFLIELMKYTANLLNKKKISFEDLKTHYNELKFVNAGQDMPLNLLNCIYEPFDDSLSEDSTF